MAFLNSTPAIDHESIVAAIRIAEVKTTGIVTVMIARHKAVDPVAAAQAYFVKAKLDQTPHRNGVLILVAPPSRNFAVIGDAGVHEKCGESFWSELAAAMTEFFKRGEFTDGLVHGVEAAGQLLGAHFPRTGRDPAAPAPSVSDVD
jgi:uncharacterized membrane protein